MATGPFGSRFRKFSYLPMVGLLPTGLCRAREILCLRSMTLRMEAIELLRACRGHNLIMIPILFFGIITPHRDSLRALERKKVEKKKWPSDTLFIENLDSATNRLRIPHVTQFSKPEKFGGWISYMIKADAIKAVAKTDTVAPDSTKTEKKEGSTDDKKKKSKKDITHLIIRQLSTGKEDTLRNVKEYIWSDRAPVVLAITQSEDSTQIAGVAVWKDHTWTYLKKRKRRIFQIVHS